MSNFKKCGFATDRRTSMDSTSIARIAPFPNPMYRRPRPMAKEYGISPCISYVFTSFLSWNSINSFVTVIAKVRFSEAQHTSTKVLFRWSARMAERPYKFPIIFKGETPTCKGLLPSLLDCSKYQNFTCLTPTVTNIRPSSLVSMAFTGALSRFSATFLWLCLSHTTTVPSCWFPIEISCVASREKLRHVIPSLWFLSSPTCCPVNWPSRANSHIRTFGSCPN